MTSQFQERSLSFQNDNDKSINSSSSQLSMNASFQSFQKANPIEFPVHIETSLAFSQGAKNFNLIIDASEERLDITLEERFDVNIWKGEYTSKYIEEICRKTGKERTFPVFLQLLIGAVENNGKGTSSLFIDLLGFQDLQLLKAKRMQTDENSQINKPQSNKRYLILTHLMQERNSKVHYPLPLNPIEPGSVFNLDKQTMKQMVQHMSKTLTDFKNMSISGASFNKEANTNESRQFPGGMNNVGRQTAKEFFSKENMSHPVVEENISLKQKLKQLEEARSMGGAVSASNLQNEKSRINQEFSSYKNLIQQEIKRLKKVKQEMSACINDVKSEIQSERPQSSYSQQLINGSQRQNNMTITSHSGFSDHASSVATEVEEIRRQLAEGSVELEELRENNKKKLAMQEKDIEDIYGELGSYGQEEKALRVKVNQLENDLELQFKRLDIICKTKGLPRPQKKLLAGEGGARGRNQGGSYVSPYRQGSNSKEAANRNGSNSKFSPFRNNYTPPNKKYSGNYSPSGMSAGSRGSKGGIPGGTQYSKNSGTRFNNYSPKESLRKSGGAGSLAGSNRNQSPGVRSNNSNNSFSKKSNTSGNRLYSPSGRVRTDNQYGYNKAGINRVRREPAVVGSATANSRSNSRDRNGETPPRKTSSSVLNKYGVRQTSTSGLSKKSSMNSQTTKQINTQASQQNSTRNAGNGKSITTAQGQSSTQQNRPTLFGGSSTNGGKESVNIDEKIEKLQSLLKMAKSGTN